MCVEKIFVFVCLDPEGRHISSQTDVCSSYLENLPCTKTTSVEYKEGELCPFCRNQPPSQQPVPDAVDPLVPIRDEMDSEVAIQTRVRPLSPDVERLNQLLARWAREDRLEMAQEQLDRLDEVVMGIDATQLDHWSHQNRITGVEHLMDCLDKRLTQLEECPDQRVRTGVIFDVTEFVIYLLLGPPFTYLVFGSLAMLPWVMLVWFVTLYLFGRVCRTSRSVDSRSRGLGG